MPIAKKPLIHRSVTVIACLTLAWFVPSYSLADEVLLQVTFVDKNEKVQTVDGKILLEAQDGGILLLGEEGTLWNITPDRLKEKTPTDKKFQPLSAEELGKQLQEELGDRFEIIRTRHYVICSSAGKAYGKWCGALFERLMSSFRTHWRSRRLTLYDPKLPLAAIVFANRDEFAKFAKEDAGPTALTSHGYYSLRTNRMVLYDFTAKPGSRRARTFGDINRKIAASPYNVATVVHEATHQIAFNCGMHTRYADNPLWLSEGMAMYFETPDLESRNGWRTVGKVNPVRMRGFRDYLKNRRQPGSLATLLADNKRFANKDLAADAYAEAWALTYFLIKTKRNNYLTYLNGIAGKRRLFWNSPSERLAEFKAAFGDDLEKLDREFIRYMQRF